MIVIDGKCVDGHFQGRNPEIELLKKQMGELERRQKIVEDFFLEHVSEDRLTHKVMSNEISAIPEKLLQLLKDNGLTVRDIEGE